MSTSTVATPKPPITQTGIKGFLLWFQREQPAIYAKIAPQLPAAAPKAFSNYNATVKSRLGRLATVNNRYNVNNPFRRRAPQIGELFSPQVTEIYTPIDVDASDVSDVNIPVVPDDSVTAAVNAPVDVGTIDAGDVSPVASAANSGISSSPTTSAIGSVIGAASAVYMTSQQAALQQQLVNTNLQRAAAGLPPLNTSVNSLGVPTVGTSGTLGNSGIWILLALGVGAVVLASGG
jgi:hypothetical protein